MDPTIAADADEFYTFPGDPAEQKPPYWVARHGRTVTHQIDNYDPRVDEYPTVDKARAEFAEEICDPTGPGAPQVGDTVYIYDLDRRIVVAGVAADTDRGWRLNPDGENLVVPFWRYRIASRPAATS